MTDRPLPFSAHTGPPAVVVSDLTVDRGHIRALDCVSLSVPTGEITVLLGPNGSGKSTLLQAMLGLVTPTGGSVRVLDSPVRRALRTGRVAAVPQSDAVDDRFPVTAGEVVMQGRRRFTGPWRRPSSADRLAVDRALDRVGLSPIAGRRIGELSGGQRRRVLLARCLAQEAELLLLDEPFNGMDAGSEEVYIDVLRDLTASGRTAVVSTHHLGTVDRLADSVALLNGGLVAHGPVAETTTPQILSTLLGARPPAVDDRAPTTEGAPR
ncbi:ABC transporter [Dietzia sp. UCD-THP]|uniref:metal ABC transporter ATP-binding protein n=1 Tax=Dietzia sp. UCD-THP TaxID=1292020 RepID=UPI00036A993B|nr:ATP-binding cassette domain-containing protein [Dietzia sp. UCD-THP]EYT63154.1 ABC transporter [Dietzia sp. UCD-THP]